MLNKINFRLLTDNDLDKIYIWLLKPYVHEWFAATVNITPEWVRKVFGDKNDCLERWIIQFDGIDIGYIQNYFYNDDINISNKYKSEIGADDNTASLDFFIGDEEYIHRGFGKIIIKQFLENIIFNNLRCKSIIVGPRVNNIASIKTLEANGFRWYKNVFDDKGRDEYMMIYNLNDS